MFFKEMNTTKFLVICSVFFMFMLNVEAKQMKKKQPIIQLAILLDTSNSMDGLIEQTKSELWKIVNKLASSKKKGVSPKLEVALYEYGNSSISSTEDYIRQVVPFTTDLDKVSEELFGLRTNGGDEFCGAVIKHAVDKLDWTKNKQALKLIFIAGNEPFNQGKTPYKESCKEAIQEGIVVNTIYCGNHQTGIQEGWKDGALLADGHYTNIDQNVKVRHISAPQDKEIASLGAELNKTYIAYGSKGRKAMARQKKQDSNAKSLSASTMVERAKFKSKKQYSNESWDLVDAAESKTVALEDMDEEQVPEEMKKMNKKERKAYVNKKLSERKKIQKKIQELSKERDAYIAKEKKKLASEDNTIDAAVIKAITALAKKKGFSF